MLTPGPQTSQRCGSVRRSRVIPMKPPLRKSVMHVELQLIELLILMCLNRVA